MLNDLEGNVSLGSSQLSSHIRLGLIESNYLSEDSLLSAHDGSEYFVLDFQLFRFYLNSTTLDKVLMTFHDLVYY